MNDNNSEQRPNELRRRLAKGGLAAPVVLATLASKPVLGTENIPYHCTISGKLSGNTSSHHDTTNCQTLGYSPGYWKNHSSWPAPMMSYSPAAGACVGSSPNVNQLFRTFFADVFRCNNGVVGDASSGIKPATLLQVLNTGGGLNDTAILALGRAAVASRLNALLFAGTYPLTPQKVTDMFNAVCNGGSYQVNATTYWNASQVKTYFESLYGAKG
jgi:hypothetical protein